MFQRVRDELRWAIRQARRRPAMALAVTATLAVAIGAATTSFGVAAAVLWRPLPFADADRLVFVWENVESGGDRHASRVTGFRYAEWKRSGSALSSIALFGAARIHGRHAGRRSLRSWRAWSRPDISTRSASRRRSGERLPPTTRLPAATRSSSSLTRSWRERFGGRRDVIGTKIRLGGAYTIIGVMPDVVFPAWPANPATVTLIRTHGSSGSPSRGHHSSRTAPPLTSSATVPASPREPRDRKPPRCWAASPIRLRRIAIRRASHRSREQFVRGARQPLLVVAAAALCVLLIACANLAALHVS